MLFHPSIIILLLFEVMESGLAIKSRFTFMDRRLPFSPSKDVRNLPVFSLVRFSNIPCSSASGQQTGICYSFTDCLKLQGTQIGTCASGFGVCCIFKRSCGTATNQNCTHFTNPEFPTEFTGSEETVCTLTLLRPTRIPVCQVRLDLLEFDLARPNDGTCESDQFTVTGQNTNFIVPTLCGLNTGQHVYVDISNSVTPISLTVTTRGQGSRKWNIKAMFIECASASRAPANCLQYYTGVQGFFSSFNYIPNLPSVESGGYLNNMNYGICFRKEAGYCTQTYTVRQTTPGTDFVILNLDQNGAPIVGSGEAGFGVNECPDDYVRLSGDRFCGTRLNPTTTGFNPTINAPVTDNTTGPFISQFVTNSMFTAVGFSLNYNQNAC